LKTTHPIIQKHAMNYTNKKGYGLRVGINWGFKCKQKKTLGINKIPYFSWGEKNHKKWGSEIFVLIWGKLFDQAGGKMHGKNKKTLAETTV